MLWGNMSRRSQYVGENKLNKNELKRNKRSL